MYGDLLKVGSLKFLEVAMIAITFWIDQQDNMGQVVYCHLILSQFFFTAWTWQPK